MTAVLRTLQENFGPRDEIRGFRPTALTNRRWFLGQDSHKVFAVSLLNETVSPTESAALDTAPLAAVVAPLVPGDTTGTHLIHVLGDDGMVTTLSTTTLAQVGTWTASGEAQTVGALAVGDYGIYAGGLGGIKYYNQETGAAQWATAGGLGWIKWLAVCRDTPDVIYAIDEGGRWGVFACDGVQVWAVPTAALDPLPDVINVMTDADYLTSAATGLAVLAKGPLSKGQVTTIDLSSPQEPSISAVSATYAAFGQTGITGAAATDRPLTQDDADAFPEIPWWAATAFAALRGPALGDALDGFVALDGLRRAWLTTEPTTAPAGASPYPAPSTGATPAPVCTLTPADTETTAATVSATCAWTTARSARPGSGVVTGGSAPVAVAAPGVASVPLSLGTNALLLTVTDALAQTAQASAAVTRRAVNVYNYGTINPIGRGFTIPAEIYGRVCRPWMDAVRTAVEASGPGAGWKIVLCSVPSLATFLALATYADLVPYEVVGGTYPTGGIACSVTEYAASGSLRQYLITDANISVTVPASGSPVYGVLVAPSGRVYGWPEYSLYNVAGDTLTHIFQTFMDPWNGIFDNTGGSPKSAIVYSAGTITSMVNPVAYDTELPGLEVICDLRDAGGGVIRSVSCATWGVSTLQSSYNVRTSYLTTPALSIPLRLADAPPASLRLWTPRTSSMFGGAALVDTTYAGLSVDPTTYTEFTFTPVISFALPGHIP